MAAWWPLAGTPAEMVIRGDGQEIADETRCPGICLIVQVCHVIFTCCSISMSKGENGEGGFKWHESILINYSAQLVASYIVNNNVNLVIIRTSLVSMYQLDNTSWLCWHQQTLIEIAQGYRLPCSFVGNGHTKQ